MRRFFLATCVAMTSAAAYAQDPTVSEETVQAGDSGYFDFTEEEVARAEGAGRTRSRYAVASFIERASRPGFVRRATAEVREASAERELLRLETRNGELVIGRLVSYLPGGSCTFANEAGDVRSFTAEEIAFLGTEQEYRRYVDSGSLDEAAATQWYDPATGRWQEAGVRLGERTMQLQFRLRDTDASEAQLVRLRRGDVFATCTLPCRMAVPAGDYDMEWLAGNGRRLSTSLAVDDDSRVEFHEERRPVLRGFGIAATVLGVVFAGAAVGLGVSEKEVPWAMSVASGVALGGGIAMTIAARPSVSFSAQQRK